MSGYNGDYIGGGAGGSGGKSAHISPMPVTAGQVFTYGRSGNVIRFLNSGETGYLYANSGLAGGNASYTNNGVGGAGGTIATGLVNALALPGKAGGNRNLRNGGKGGDSVDALGGLPNISSPGEAGGFPGAGGAGGTSWYRSSNGTQVSDVGGQGGAERIRITWFEGETVVRPANASLSIASSGPYATAIERGEVYLTTYGWVGQYKESANRFDIDQVMLSFDMNGLPNRVITAATLNIGVSEAYGVNNIEVRRHDWAADTSAFVSASTITSKPLIGTATIAKADVYQIPLTGITRNGTLKIALLPRDQRTATPPVADDTSLLLTTQTSLTLEFGEPIVESVPVTVLGQSGSMTIAGQSGSASAGASVSSTAGSLTFSGYVGQVTAAAVSEGSQGQLSITGGVGSVSASAIIEGFASALTFSGHEGSVTAVTSIPAVIYGQAGALAITGQQGSVKTGTSIGVIVSGQSGSLVLTGQAGSTKASASVSGQSSALTFMGQVGSVSTTKINVELYPDPDCILSSLPDVRVLSTLPDTRVLEAPADVRTVNTTSDLRVLPSI